LDLVGSEDLDKLFNFISDFQKLEEQMRGKVSRIQIQQALLLYDNNFENSFIFLQECQNLHQMDIDDAQIFQAMEFFKADLDVAKQFLIGYQKLKSFGFSHLLITEALIMTNHNYEKAVQFCLDKTQ